MYYSDETTSEVLYFDELRAIIYIILESYLLLLTDDFKFLRSYLICVRLQSVPRRPPFRNMLKT